MKIEIPISVGELIDKITILEIKYLFTDDEYVVKELEELNLIKSALTQYTLEYEVQLKKVNEKLWKIEDKLRQLEKEQRFDNEFIELARSVYITNDERAQIKREINQLTNSDFREIKVY
jgi:predicted  nucleic acid-binding Zn-ribbon protein